MADETQVPTTPAGSEPGTSIEKFKTPEDRDKAYLELEKQNSEQARRLADVEARLEAFAVMAPPAQPAPQPSFTDLYPSQKTNQEREQELAARLLTRPTEVLETYGRRVREDTLNEVRAQLDNERLVNRFRSDHPDLAPHEEIVAMFVRKQPENLPSAHRLKLAIPEARKYLATLAGKPVTQTLDPSTYVEAPTQRPSAPATVAAEPSEEDELTASIRERAALMQKKMRV